MSNMKYTHDIVVSREKYTDKDGNEKNSYETIGKAFTREDGSMCILLRNQPIGEPAWNGWANLYERREEDQQ